MFSTQYFQHDNDNDSIAIAAVFNKSPLGLILTFKKKAVAPTITGFETIGAAQGGHLQIGDEVVAANGVSLEGISHEEVLTIIRDAKYPIRLVLRRRLLGSSFRQTVPALNHDYDYDYLQPVQPPVSTASIYSTSTSTSSSSSSTSSSSSDRPSHGNSQTEVIAKLGQFVDRFEAVLDRFEENRRNSLASMVEVTEGAKQLSMVLHDLQGMQSVVSGFQSRLAMLEARKAGAALRSRDRLAAEDEAASAATAGARDRDRDRDRDRTAALDGGDEEVAAYLDAAEC